MRIMTAALIVMALIVMAASAAFANHGDKPGDKPGDGPPKEGPNHGGKGGADHEINGPELDCNQVRRDPYASQQDKERCGIVN